ncbi:type III secretion system export apparatus subunit SctR [uncultured Roseibium sp.]|uniref:type III secretion system export apparatus subunit SctR n=1 Tax=uncultured Roseibium sp. TaxID=1936171 RepID=UPI002624B4A2|nr:type III secretion system export apparatus subunit SctR [uncultured Roseibium sp.]
MPAVYPSFLAIMALSLLPFFVVMGTAYTKISIVLMLLRNALGVQQAPSGLVLNSIAMTLTVFIMVPVGDAILTEVRDRNLSMNSLEDAMSAFEVVTLNMKVYLTKHSTDQDLKFFMEAAKAMWPENLSRHIVADNLFLLLPAHVVSEISRAFQIAFLLFLPFVVIDMVVSNILLALGAMMVPPMMISLPIKLLLFVAVDGWSRLLHALILSYL